MRTFLIMTCGHRGEGRCSSSGGRTFSLDMVAGTEVWDMKRVWSEYSHGFFIT
jgi:hypothetical protein